ncbi:MULTISPECIES: acyl-CoA dehydrogenase family protein [unclassified Bosea (in: a-proteobacteria)]|uniref:acyl-CoA dehydrogenase family protein n=1 Tax=unclassified Bosea (in: a-proteobacteria) TaxID=2653178 RepID=UPI000F761691|nr:MULTISPECIES: acyl-CoA dehydrogenase family protein [unclassified Bosea (in: a-proteobacteria)]AZO80517.1 acyl-CoA dehydrogenase [Bosea sp. Tri-49]RXT23323.1 acyl-CoA dehydrogenase [Bosea sp. Tri-39]RXT38796.1 acyl-CoA dehydrogenase [Bosea sp. Tri-54]
MGAFQTPAAASLLSPALTLPVAARPDELAAVFAEIALTSSERDARREHPFDLLAKLRALRFGALRLPESDGGAGASWREVLGALVRLGEADSSVAHIFRNHFFVTERFVTGREPGYNLAWRKAVADGALIGLATTELDRKQTGGRGDLKTRLTRDGDGYRLDGTKFYSTGTLYADLTLVRAISPEGEDVSLIIPTDREGVERLDDWDGIGQRVTGTGTTNFHSVRVEADELLADTSPYVQPFASTIAQTIVTAVNAGVLRAVLRDAKSLLLNRKRNFYYALSEVPAEDPLLQQTIGRIASEAFIAELGILAVGDALDVVATLRATDPDDARLPALVHEASLTAAKTKVVVDEFVLRSSTALFDVGGASAATLRQNLDRHWRNARTLSSHNPAGYKALALGAYELKGTPLPALGFF